MLYASNSESRAKCERILIANKNGVSSNVISSVCDIYGNRIDLFYSKQNRRIWLNSKRLKHKEFTIIQLEKGANPEFIGAEHDIQILFGNTIKLQEREFLFLTVAERTNRGDGGGQCGAGEEIYLKIYEFIKNDLFERKSFLIHSCATFIDLDTGDGSNNSIEWPIVVEDGTIQIKWLGYTHYEGRVLGSFSILENSLHVTPIKESAK